MTDLELCHYGVRGMKWGIRRYQRKDGSLTEAGKMRIQKDSDMYFYDYRRKERKLRDPITNRKAVKENAILKQAAEDYKKVSLAERDRLLQEKTTLKKAGYLFIKNPDSDQQEHNADLLSYIHSQQPRVKAAQKAYTEKEVDVFADALISDMSLKNTEAAKTFVKDCLIENNRVIRTHLGLPRK